MTTLMPGHAPLKFHPLANLFPMLSEEELDALGKDIRENGQVETVKLHKGQILDGRNRYVACTRFSLPVRTEIFQGSDREALNWVVSKNLMRRHLKEGVRAAVAANIVTLKLGANQHTAGQAAQNCAPSLDFGSDHAAPEAEPAVSQQDAADMMNVSRRSVQSAMLVKEKAPEVFEEVEKGNIAPSAAAKIAERPAEEQKAILDSLPRDESGKLTPEAKKQVRKIAKEVRAEDQAEKKKKRSEKEAALGARILALPDIKAGLILSDFEWDFKVRSRETGMDRHASNHYVTATDCNTPEEIVERQRERMQVAADDCVHLMWVPACFSEIGHQVMRLQGFTYVSQFVWIKPGMGTGFWVRDCHELLFIGVKGKVPAPSMGEQFRSAIEAPKGEHSEKPDFQYEIAEHYFPSLPKVELNARRHREGWIQWGNEAPQPEQPTLALDENDCPGHVSSEHDPEVCGRCGVHIDSLRPPEEEQVA